jgi:3-deoxy-D-manno-octulosonic-acid transferase
MGVAGDRVTVCDTMKWDSARIAEPNDIAGADALAQAMGLDRAKPIIVAGSTAPGEDQLLIDDCPHEAQLVLVPRKPEWFDAAARIAPGIVRRSAHPDGTVRPLDDQRLFLLDTMGELQKAYALADVAIVGRSFLGLYGSDVMEPAALGKPTIIGPFHADFADTVAALQAADGLIVTDQPGRVAGELLADPQRARELADHARQAIRGRQGATARHAAMLQALIAKQVGQSVTCREAGAGRFSR